MNELRQTWESFGEKWRAFSDYQIGGASEFDSDTLTWIVTRNGFSSLSDFGDHVKKFGSILDAGCGNGRMLGVLAELADPAARLFGLDFSAARIAEANLGERVCHVYDADLTDTNALAEVQPVEFIYCQEVLHHTANPILAFKNLVKLLLPGGEIAVYVYKKKSPIREYTDDYVRGRFVDADHEKALELASQFTQLGKVLSELDVEVEIPEVSCLEIPAGKYTVQRFLYHFFAKCYWNPELSEAANDMINYDWYHPAICSRHTLEEVRDWFEDAGLDIVHEFVDEYGITMRGQKSA